MQYLKMSDQDLAGKRVMIRLDLNVPITDGQIVSDARIRAALPTVQQAHDAGAAVILLSHLGRPTEGKPEPDYSLAPVAEHLSTLLGLEVPLFETWLDGIDISPGQVVLCENVRFNRGETNDSEELARRMAALCDVFVMDAFGTAHRAHASTHGVARFAAIACAGPLLSGELEALGQALEDPTRPLVAIVGGAKVSTKLTVLEALAERVDRLIVGGGIANTFIAAAGYPVGRSLYEPDMLGVARGLAESTDVPLPQDVVVAEEISADAAATIRPVTEVRDQERIVDIGPATAALYSQALAAAGTIVWNGPIGVFEYDQFGAGTRRIAEAVANSPAFSIAGGGDTLAALEKYRLADRISYVSTGGGAFLEFLKGGTLPTIAVLASRAA